jgi:choline-sulfatase
MPVATPAPPNFGGGRADHDARYIEQAVSFLRERATQNDSTPPFCLVVSRVNPHDLLAFPRDWQDDYTPRDLEGDVELPESFDEDLAGNFKPTAHALMRPAIDIAVGKFQSREQHVQYVNFYANLVERIDRQIAPIIDCFYRPDHRPTRLGEDTVIVRFSDHGELGLAHGGLRQKAFNVYEESIRVPLIIAQPPAGPRRPDLPAPCIAAGSPADVADLLGVEPLPGLRGTSLAPLVRDAGAPPVNPERAVSARR